MHNTDRSTFNDANFSCDKPSCEWSRVRGCNGVHMVMGELNPSRLSRGVLYDGDAPDGGRQSKLIRDRTRVRVSRQFRPRS